MQAERSVSAEHVAVAAGHFPSVPFDMGVLPYKCNVSTYCCERLQNQQAFRQPCELHIGRSEHVQTGAKHVAAQTGCCHMDIPNAGTLVSIAAGVSKADATPLPA